MELMVLVPAMSPMGSNSLLMMTSSTAVACPKAVFVVQGLPSPIVHIFRPCSAIGVEVVVAAAELSTLLPSGNQVTVVEVGAEGEAEAINKCYQNCSTVASRKSYWNTFHLPYMPKKLNWGN